MSKAPERIWAYAGSFKMWRDHKTDQPYTQTEYVRADMLQEIFARYSKAESDRIEELEAKLAKAVTERDEALNQLDSAIHSAEVLLKRVAKLKGQDDE